MDNRNRSRGKSAAAPRPPGKGRTVSARPVASRPAPVRPASPPTPKKKKRRRKGNNTLYYALTVVFVLALSITLSLTVFFKVSEVKVSGTERYPAAQLISASGVKIGDNLLRVSQDKVGDRLAAFPYVESVQVKREFPPRIHLVITEAVPLAAVGSEGSYTIVSEHGRILETGVTGAPQGVLTANGPGILGSPGEMVREDQQEYVRMLSGLREAIKSNDFGGISTIDVSDRLNIVLSYDDRVTIQLGSERELGYKLRQVKRVLDEYLETDFRGNIDATTAGEVRTRPYHDASTLLFADSGESPDGESQPAQEPVPPEEGESG